MMIENPTDPFMRILYDNKSNELKSKESILKYYYNLDGNILGKQATEYILTTDRSINQKLIEITEKSKCKFILLSSIFTYANPINDEDLNDMSEVYMYQPLLIEKTSRKHINPLILPFSSCKSHIINELYKNNLLAMAINREEFLSLIEKGKINGIDSIVKLLENQEYEKELNNEISEKSSKAAISLIDIGNEKLNIDTNTYLRIDRIPLKIQRLDNVADFINLNPILFCQIPSVRFVLTEKDEGIFTSQYFPTTIFIRINKNITKNKQLKEIAGRFSLNDNTLYIAEELIQCEN